MEQKQVAPITEEGSMKRAALVYTAPDHRAMVSMSL